MYWADGTIYKGLWDKGSQNGPGILILPNSVKKAAIFQGNTLVEMLENEESLEKIRSEVPPFSLPNTFFTEIKGTFGSNDDNSTYLNKVFDVSMNEDLMEPCALPYSQDIPEAPFMPQ